MRIRTEKNTRGLKTGLFLALLLSVGILNSADGDFADFPNTIAACIELMAYFGLILSWLQSVRTRLLPSRARNYILFAGLLMMLFLFLRIFKYRILPDEAVALRIVWYAFYIPFLLIPTLFLMCCISFTKTEVKAGFDERFLLIPAALLITGMLSNELHHLAFSPVPGFNGFWMAEGTYRHGLLFYAAYGWVGLCAAGGVILLIITSSVQRDWEKAVFPLMFFVLVPVLDRSRVLLERFGIDPLYKFPEICIFCMLGVFEACIRERLIPWNENYSGFFREMRFPVLITDRNMTPVYHSAAEVPEDRILLQRSLQSPVYTDPDTRLSGMAVTAGFVFFTEDESGLHRMNERLEEANETISLENRLIAYENEQKEERARIDARNAIYEKAAAEVYPAQKKIERLLESAVPGTPGFRMTAARISVLNAYVKRKSNFVLTASEAGEVSAADLFLALQEMTRFLEFCGILASAENKASGSFPYGETLALYDSFEILTEERMPSIRKMLVLLTKEGIRITTDGTIPETLPETPVRITAESAEEFCSFMILREKGGAG